MEDLSQRIERIENTLERHSERLVTIEGKLANDYKSIMTLLDDVKNLRDQNTLTMKKVETLESKVDSFITKLDRMEQDQKARDASVSNTLKKQNRLLICAIVLSIAALTYATIQNGTTASAITALVSTLAKIGLV